jgi:hypothetical protein
MKFSKKVVIAMDLSQEPLDSLKSIKTLDFLNGSEIHFVHVFNTYNYSFMFGDFPLIYPIEADRKALEEGVINLLKEKTKGILPQGFSGTTVMKCLFADDPKSRFCEYLKVESPSLVIVPARKKHGFFDSSFAQYIGRHSEANLLILKREF